MDDRILFVDDSRVVLELASELFSSRGITILTANNGLEAIEIIRHQDIAVVVSDNVMPGISGVEFLTRMKEISPETVKILMTGNADIACVLEAINRCEVFRFILKPWQDEELFAIVQEAVRRHHLLLSLRHEEEEGLRYLAHAIELKDPYTKGHCDRVAVLALQIADLLQLPREMKREIKYGSWLHDCGKIGVSEAILNGSQRLSDEEIETMKMHVNWGADLAAKANLSPVARNIIRFHHERYDGTGYPTGIGGADIPLEARIVSVADVYDALMSDRPYRKMYSYKKTVEILHGMKGSVLDPEIVDLFLLSVSPAVAPALSPAAATSLQPC